MFNNYWFHSPGTAFSYRLTTLKPQSGLPVATRLSSTPKYFIQFPLMLFEWQFNKIILFLLVARKVSEG